MIVQTAHMAQIISKVNVKSTVGVVIGVLSLWWIVSFSTFANAEFSETGQPTTYEFSFAPAALHGYGDVLFGMSMKEVEAGLAIMFPGKEIEFTLEPVHQTPVLHLSVPELAPMEGGPALGPAAMAFVFGYRSQRLMAINLEWFTAGDATPTQRDALLQTGTAYVAHLLQHFWQPFAASRGVVIGPNEVILFAGRDPAGRGVEVVVDGVPLDVERLDGTTEHRPIDKGAANLRIRLSAQPDDPDIYTLPPGSF